jgi:hypothetical protein
MFRTSTPPETWVTSAQLSTDGVHRFNLVRQWRENAPRVCWIMLNPSTADATVDDHTIRKCIGFTRSFMTGGDAFGTRYGSLEVVNLFAYRATRPKDLKQQLPERAIGPCNDYAILDACNRARLVICAWGVHGTWLGRNGAVKKLLRERGWRPQCLCLSKDGHPMHPLTLGYNLKPIPFPLEDA